MKKILLALVVLICFSASAKANLITNGGFEAGTLSPWTVTNNVSVVSSGPHSGSYDALFQQVSSPSFDTLSQTINAGPGKYDLDFWLYYNDNTSQEFKVTFDGNTVLDLTTQLQTGGGAYKHVTVKGITTNSASTKLIFSSQNPAYYMRLDDVNLIASAAVPEPSSATLLGLGAVGLTIGAYRRRRLASV